MSKTVNTLLAVPGIAIAFFLTSCAKQYYPEKIPCEQTSLGQAGILGDSAQFEFHRYKIPYASVLSARIDRKGGRYYVVVHTRNGKTYSYFTTSERQASRIYALIHCKSNL
jgi:hypothetical protein